MLNPHQIFLDKNDSYGFRSFVSNVALGLNGILFLICFWGICTFLSYALNNVQEFNMVRNQTWTGIVTGSNSKTSSGANTPVRKISAQEFERGGQILKPMVSTVDGTPTFLGSLVSASGSDHILFSKVQNSYLHEVNSLNVSGSFRRLQSYVCKFLINNAERLLRPSVR